MKLKSNFFEKETLNVARNLLGKILVVDKNQIMITEVEAYIGENDEASHARFGKTKRNYVMYKKAGFIYVYMIYGMYFCLNIVTEKENFPSAILIRGGYYINQKEYINGPGKLCKLLKIDTKYNDKHVDEMKNFYFLNTQFGNW